MFTHAKLDSDVLTNAWHLRISSRDARTTHITLVQREHMCKHPSCQLIHFGRIVLVRIAVLRQPAQPLPPEPPCHADSGLRHRPCSGDRQRLGRRNGTVKSEKLYCEQAPGFNVKTKDGAPMVCEIPVALQGHVDAARLFGDRRVAPSIQLAVGGS